MNSLSKIIFVYLLCVHANVPHSICGGQNTASLNCFSFYNVGPEDGIQAISLGRKHLYPLSYLMVQVMSSLVGWLLNNCLRI